MENDRQSLWELGMKLVCRELNGSCLRLKEKHCFEVWLSWVRLSRKLMERSVTYLFTLLRCSKHTKWSYYHHVFVVSSFLFYNSSSVSAQFKKGKVHPIHNITFYKTESKTWFAFRYSHYCHHHHQQLNDKTRGQKFYTS